MKSSKFLQAVCLALVAISATGCGWVAPDAGQAGVIIRKPWFFGHGGIDPNAVTTGRSLVAASTQVKYVNLQPRAFVLEYNDIMSKDGIPLDFSATATLQVTDPVELVRDFSGGADDVNGQPAYYVNNLEPVENNYVRDAFKGQDMHALAIATTGTNAVEADVKQRLERYIEQRHIPVKVVNFTLGRVNPPKEIKSQRVKTAEEQQRQETEKQTKIAEDNRRAAEQARANADDAYRTAMNLTPEQFVELQRIQMIGKVCDSGDKKGPRCTFVVGNATALVNSTSGK